MVYIKLFGPFADLLEGKNEEGFFESESAGKTLGELLSGIDFGGAKYIALVNNTRAEKDYILKDGDKVGIMPLLAGG